ncbi:MAG: SCO family protein [Aromatoleum sp.]|jgi:protein SCO1/2|uniref:SCO family protein n=1 Tax=Aromatoleum sp. TaxID=2307007 RepID=UPI00289476D9|nr:SCO family protein [Aromatoleum sp.]MDT3670933.1 SCO family protein [Aromatoleum sp.]
MSTLVRGLVSTALVVACGTAAFWWGTDGFSAYTAEAARRADILRSPRPVPTVVLEDQDGRRFSLEDYRGRLLAVEFIYTRCMTVCRSLGLAFRQIREAVPPEALERDFALLSISFDPERDDPASLKAYGRNFGADGEHWRLARVRDAGELAALLAAFGVVVISDRFGGFEHNAAIHLVGRDGRLVEISDLDEPLAFAGKVREKL